MKCHLIHYFHECHKGTGTGGRQGSLCSDQGDICNGGSG